MFIRKFALAWLVLIPLAAASCSSLVTAYLLNQLLNDKAPRYTWAGTVTDQTGHRLVGVTVQIAAEVAGDQDIIHYSDATDDEGVFDISYRWSSEVNYSVHIIDASDVEIYTQDYGKVEKGDRHNDFVVSGAVGAELSGVIHDAAGNPVAGAVVIGATVSALTDTPVIMNGGGGKPAYFVTSDAGIYTLHGAISRYGIICVFHPDHGFAYSYAEDLDGNGQIALNADMGGSGRYSIDAQVIDGLGQPVANRVLTPDQQFRLIAKQPFNLSATMDTVVHDNSLFPALATNPSVQQPTDITFTVAATGVNGIATGLQNVLGGNYSLQLLRTDNDDPATALVISNNPLILGANATVIVRVN